MGKLTIGDVSSGIGLISGIAGMFGKKKKDPMAALKAQYMKQYQDRQNQLWSRAQSYDPMRETRDATDFAAEVSGRAIRNAHAGINQRYKNMGGSPTGDTNFGLIAQRATDDVLNPLAQMAADRSAMSFQLKQQAMASALGAPPGQMMDAYESMRSQPNPYPALSQQLAMQSLDSLFNKGKRVGKGKGGNNSYVNEFPR